MFVASLMVLTFSALTQRPPGWHVGGGESLAVQHVGLTSREGELNLSQTRHWVCHFV